MPSEHGAVDLSGLSEEAQERLAEMGKDVPEQEEEEYDSTTQVLTAFAVVLDLNGQWSFYPFEGLPTLRESVPLTPDLVYSGASTVLKDVAAQEAAQATVALQMQQAQAIAQQQAAQRQAAQLGDLRGGVRG